MKIYAHQPISFSAEIEAIRLYFEAQEKQMRAVARPGTQIVRRVPSIGITNATDTNYPSLRAINHNTIVKSIVEAEKEGADAIVMNCWFDPAIETTRQVVDIPVVGIAEASMHLASIMGGKFAAITSNVEYVPSMEEMIHHYRMTGRAITVKPVRATLLNVADEFSCLVNRDYGPFRKDFVEIAEGCIADGAEVIIGACALLATLLGESGLTEVKGVPVINPVKVGVKWAEMLVDLKSLGMPIISRKGINLAPPPGAAEALLKAVCK